MTSSSSSSSVITCISSALQDVDLLMSRLVGRDADIIEKACYRLRILKTFVFLAGNFGNKDGRLRSLLIKIEIASQKIHSSFIGLEGTLTPDQLGSHGKKIARDFRYVCQSLKEEIDQWYVAMSDNTRQSNSLTADEVGEISESILENLVVLPPDRRYLAEEMEPLREHMDFLKSFRRFATSRGVGHRQMKDFLTHTEAVAISASHLCWYLCGDEFILWKEDVQPKISMIVQKIKPIDPRVCEAYTQVISCSKLSTRLDAPTGDMNDDSTIVMKNFVDSLIPILWYMLRRLDLDACHVICLKDNWQLLYEGLRSLRTILKKLHYSIDENTMDDIGVVVCDAGALVCSLYQENVKIDCGLGDLLERIKVLAEKVGEKVPQTSIFNPSSINEPRLVDVLLENLMELTNGKVEPILQGRVQSIKEELLYLRSFFGEIVELRHEQEELRALWNSVLKVAYRVEFLIDSLIAGNISDSFSMQFDSIIYDIHNIKTDDWKSSYGKIQDRKVKEVTSTSSHVIPSPKFASLTTEIVGFHDEARSIMDRLQRGSKQLRVIGIVGMGGLGKTTLAAKVYDDPEVMRYFTAHARCTVSQTLDKKKLLLELLDQICPEKFSELTEDDLVEKLWKRLKGKRYLIFLDDVWTTEAWNSLKASFPDDSTGSRIILTSRNHVVASLAMLGEEPLCLRQLSEKESLELLQMKLFPREDWPPALYDLRMQIVEKCKGLPLTIVLVAGLLATTEQEHWKEIVDGVSSGTVSITELCMSSIELSYRHLPHYLKPCFLYFGAFPEDREVSVRRLIQLWIAEGFIQKSDLNSLEDAAEDYMKDLIGRSLIMIAKQRSIGGARTCRIHDLLHDFCLRKAKDEHFFHLLKGYDELLAFNEPCDIRRLCIHSDPKHLKESKVFCPRARSILFFAPKREWQEREEKFWIDIFLVHIFKFVRVLDLEDISLRSAFSLFPSEIKLLVQLRYLAIRGYISVIPSWVGDLSMLETLILILGETDAEVSLPDSIWNLRKLKFLYIRGFDGYGGGKLPIQNLDNSPVLHELDTFCGAAFFYRDSVEKQMRKFPNARRLKCRLDFRGYDSKEEECLNLPSRLESLTMYMRQRPRIPEFQLELSYPANLKKLTLEKLWLPWRRISTIGKLPNLEVLKLRRDSFRGTTWEMGEGEFLSLRYLKLENLELVRWRASDDSDDQFPCLEKLALRSCWGLEEMPSPCLESSTTLEMIEVRYCPRVERLVKRIKEQQEVNMGNTALHIYLLGGER